MIEIRKARIKAHHCSNTGIGDLLCRVGQVLAGIDDADAGLGRGRTGSRRMRRRRKHADHGAAAKAGEKLSTIHVYENLHTELISRTLPLSLWRVSARALR